MDVASRIIDEERKYEKLFSVCTMVTDKEEYAVMKNSFINCGFNGDCEFLVADNTTSNRFDAFEAIRRFLREAAGRYIIIVHQDVRCIDHRDDLENKLDELSQLDPLWAVCGNAGANGYKKFKFNIRNKGVERKSSGLPARVTSLDENLLIINSKCELSVSADIGGFHFYGTDLCIMADFLGYRCYVIGFLVEHLSGGNLKELALHEPRFIETYGRKLRHRFIQTTCTKFELSHSPARNKFLNSPFIFFWLKAGTRISGIFKKNN